MFYDTPLPEEKILGIVGKNLNSVSYARIYLPLLLSTCDCPSSISSLKIRIAAEIKLRISSVIPTLFHEIYDLFRKLRREIISS